MAGRIEQDGPEVPHEKANHEAKADEQATSTLDQQRIEHDYAQIRNDGTSENVVTADEKRPAGANDCEVAETPQTKPLLVKVPKGQRRGLFARLALIAEVREPVQYPNSTKWLITFVIALAAAAAPVGSAIILPVLNQVSNEFQADATVTNLAVSMYMISMALAPLWWSSFSETAGRRTVYIISFALFALFNILSALSQNIGMFIAMRLLNGAAAASVQSVGAGTIADLWESHERGYAMGWFYLGPLLGPLISPIVGGVLGEVLGWRATLWALTVYGAVLWILILFALPETLKSTQNVIAAAAAAEEHDSIQPTLTRTSTRESVQKKSKQYVRIFRMLLVEPLAVIGYLRFPLVLLCVYCSAVTFGSLYVLNISIQYTFQRSPYNFSTLIVGLLYVPNSLGYVLASILGGRWIDKIMMREARKRQKDSRDPLLLLPEDRMRENAWLGALLYPTALMWYGWTAGYGVSWFCPMIANFFYGIGSMLIFSMATTMLTEYMPERSSSGVALNNLCRNILSCVGSLAGAPAIRGIGNGWLFTIVGLWTLISGPIAIWACRRFGPKWRKHMDAALS